MSNEEEIELTDRPKSNVKEKHFTSSIKCGHCQNETHMEIVSDYSNVEAHDEHDTYWEAGPVYEICKCPACDKVSFRRYFYHDGMDPSEAEYVTLYPRTKKGLRGLPPKIHTAYEAAEKVRNIDANAYGVLLGRVLDLVCEDRKASGDTLDQKLKSLAKNGEIPSKLVDVAAGVRKLRNVGAHANLGELTEAELPVLDDLTRAILEYVYSAPLLATEAEKRLAELKAKTATKS
jgi:hypothetical protein